MGKYINLHSDGGTPGCFATAGGCLMLILAAIGLLVVVGAIMK